MNGYKLVNTVNIGSHDTWIGGVISKNFNKNQNVRCLNCHLKRDSRQGISRNNVFSRANPKRPQPSVYAGVAKAGTGETNECRSTRDRQGNPLPSQNALRGLLQAPCQIWFNHSLPPLGKLLHRVIKRLNACCEKPYCSG